MPDTFRGKFTGTNYFRKLKRLWSANIRIGVVSDGNRQYYSTFSLFVPAPRHAEDIPAVFLTLSNSSGTCFARLNTGDLDDLSQFLSDMQTHASTARTNAQIIANQYQEALRIVLNKSSTSTTTSRPERPEDRQRKHSLEQDIEHQYNKEQEAKDLMSQTPFTP